MGLLDLPAELRNHIYTYIFSPASNRQYLGDELYRYNYRDCLAILQLNRQIYCEARKVFHDRNTFIRVATPWEQVKHHICIDGRVSLILIDEKADRFKLQSLDIEIEAYYPANEPVEGYHRFVLLLEDGGLERFCKSWFYSSVTMPYMNRHLSLTLKLRDAYKNGSSLFPSTDEPVVKKALQQRLFEPFGQVKELRQFQASGTPMPYSSIVADVKQQMAMPIDSPEQCLTKATEIKDQGNAALTAGRYEEAIQYYNKAFLALHVIIEGRQRKVYGDQYFDTIIKSESSAFKGQHAGTARIKLRVQLVANTCLAYLKLKDYDMAIHTGMRTIRIIRSSIGLDEDDGASEPSVEAIMSFIAATEMGKIYYRTALAYKEIDEKSEARRLLKVAALYLPNDETVKRELASVALRLG